MRTTDRAVSLLACPRTHAPLYPSRGGESFRPIERTGFQAPQIGVTAELFVTQGGNCAFPVTDGFPALMWPEALLPQGHGQKVDLRDFRYWEAYSEMEFYNPVSYAGAENIKSTAGYATLKKLIDDKIDPEKFPEPEFHWLDFGFDMQSSLDCLRYIAPVAGKVVVQLGGQGRGAVRLLLAGAAEAILVTPMVGECAFAWRLAESLGVADRLSCVLGLGEEIPLRDEAVDVIISLGCLHHMRLDLALPEIRRVLKIGGKFAALDPWRAPLYGMGTKLFGKREQGIFNRSKSVFCQPLTGERLSSLRELFPTHIVRNHGPLLRYPLLALNKLGFGFSKGAMLKLSRWDDSLGRFIGLSDNWGGSVMIGGQRI